MLKFPGHLSCSSLVDRLVVVPCWYAVFKVKRQPCQCQESTAESSSRLSRGNHDILSLTSIYRPSGNVDTFRGLHGNGIPK